MATKIFVSPPVEALCTSVLFFRSLGVDLDGKLSDGAVIWTIVSGDIKAMLWIPPCHLTTARGAVASGSGITRQ